MDMATPLVVWDPALLAYQLSSDHPLNPVRLDLTIALATELGVLDGISTYSPVPATDDVLLRLHTPEYLETVKSASLPGAEVTWWPDELGHGLGTGDNPVFEG